MPTIDPAAAPDSAATPAESDIQRMIAEEVGKAINGRLFKGGALGKMISEALASALPQHLESALEKMAQVEEPAKPTPADDAGKLSMKALQDQLAGMQKALEGERTARAAAEAGTKQARLHAEVRGEFAKHLGADNPMLKPLLDSYLKVQQRFDLDANGNTVVKFQRDGFEEPLSLADGFKELLATELKAFVPAKGANLPPARVNGHGQPQRGPAAPSPGLPFFVQNAIADIAKSQPEIAAALDQQTAPK